jgi:hypothetical protein
MKKIWAFGLALVALTGCTQEEEDQAMVPDIAGPWELTHVATAEAAGFSSWEDVRKWRDAFDWNGAKEAIDMNEYTGVFSAFLTDPASLPQTPMGNFVVYPTNEIDDPDKERGFHVLIFLTVDTWIIYRVVDVSETNLILELADKDIRDVRPNVPFVFERGFFTKKANADSENKIE